MTSATSLSKGSVFRMFFSGRLFLDNNKRSWSVMLLLFLLIFFSCPVVMLLTLNYYSKTSSFEHIVNQLIKQPLTVLMYVYAVIFALISVGLVMGYMHSKRSSFFYGSLPIKRETLFVTQYITGVVLFLIPFLANVLLTMGVIGIFGALPSLSANVFLGWIIKTLAVYLVTFAFSTLASNLSGMKSTSIMVLLIFYFYMPALYFSIIAYSEVLYRYFDVDYLLNSMQVIKLSPVINTFYILQETTTLSGVVTLLLYILIPTGIAFRLTHRQNYELSENTITFKTFQSVLKYAVIFPCAILGALLFYAMGEMNNNHGVYTNITPAGAAWLIFGAISGGLLSYMIINVILNKNFKALFDKFRNFAIFAGIFAVLFTFFAADFAGLDTYVPTESAVIGVMLYNNYTYTSGKLISYSSSIQYNENDRVISDKDLIAQINKISKIMIEYGESGVWKDLESWDMYTFRPIYKLGPITLPKRMSIPMNLIADELDKLYEKTEFLKYNYYPLLEENLEQIIRDYAVEGIYTLNAETENRASIVYQNTGKFQPNTSYELTLDEIVNLFNNISSDLKNTDTLLSESHVAMQLFIHGYNNGKSFNLDIEITEKFTNTIAYLTEKGIINEKAYSEAAEFIDMLTLYTTETKLLITKKEEIVMILENLTDFSYKENAVRVSIQMSGDSYDTEIGYIDQANLPESVKVRLSGKQ